MKNKKVIGILLILLMFISAADLFAQSSATGRSRGARSYNVTIKTNVTSAQLYLDNNRVKLDPRDPYPATLSLSRGEHTITLRASGYEEWERKFNITGEITITANLQKARYSVRVSANVGNANLYVDGSQVKGSLPTTVQVDAGNHNFRITASGYYDWSQNLNITGDQAIQAKLDPMRYSLTVTSNVSNSRVYLNGSYKGSPTYKEDLEPGTYSVTVSAPGYNDFSTSIRLNGNETIHAVLQPSKAKATVSIDPKYLNPYIRNPLNDVEVYVDNTRQSGLTFQTNPGRTRIRIVSGGLSVEGDFVLKPGEEYTIEPKIELNIR
jgi:hypothetical protein